ncbi:hypothetical protein FRZ67_07235 [Panacibacter ginsenosidivorans]|uniref:Uncharacterized protein n=1 Tax=Panacibacter ginsenosidivorans TaxID=1813871 RepID=A0A5B8V8D2_9BACT|nr:hypothetical protein [Panacibacter ginsenosidivorans]QEC67091.1 hypothetical protein FRZ67_07235 [Panacibacter ginsenosidivorans]
MLRLIVICFSSLLLFSCKEKKVSLAGSDPVDAKDFMAAFPALKLPYKIADTNMVKLADTTNISYVVFSGFIPDSALISLLGKNVSKSKIKPVGKIETEKETYLLTEFTQNKKATLVTFLLDKKSSYLSGLVLLKQGDKDGYLHSVNITSEPTFIISKEKYSSTNELMYTRNGYAYNNGSAAFIAVMNDSNEDLKRINEVINPIDTFPRLNKLSGDYVQDKKNYISIRDGRNTSKYQFFIHFEKNDGDCTGELKGIMTMQDATHGYFQESGDPCEIDFRFTTSSIIVKERGNCGNHRGIKCFFNDTYRKKKDAKPTSKKKTEK